MLFYGAVAVVCIIALLAIPIEIVFSVQRHEKFEKSVSIGWLFGIVRFTPPLNGSEPKPERPKKEKKRSGKENGRRAIAVARNRSFRLRLIRFIKDIFGAVHLSDLTLRARLGLGDSADTGMLWGFIGPVAGFLASIRKAIIRIEPEFMYETFELDSKGRVRLIPLQFLFIMFAFILSPVTLRVIWGLR